MRKFFKNYWNQILSLGFVFLLSFSIIQCSKDRHLNSRIDTLNSNFKKLVNNDSTLVKEIKYLQFKEDAYIKQLDRDTNLILWFVALIFGVFGLISFTSFNRRVESIEEDLGEKYKKHISDLNKIKSQVYELESDLNFDSYNLYEERARKCLDNENYDAFVFYQLSGLRKLGFFYEYQILKKADNPIIDKIIGSTNSGLNYILTNIEPLEEKPKMEKDSFNNLCDVIRKIEDSDVKEKLSKIHLEMDLTN